MVSREFLAAILSLPYPWFDFLVATFTLYMSLTNLQPAGQPSASALKQFPTQEGTSFTWEKVTLPVGTGFTVSLKDGHGQQVYSAPATVQDGGDSSCVSHDVKEGKEASASGSATSTSVSPGVAAVSPGTSSSPAATGSPTSSSSTPASHKSELAKSSSSASPSQSVKANSVARDISSGVIAGIMFAVGLTSILVTLVV
ncbi:hypothetical protein DFH94DRAFT_711071 [Russula ochroleuca]|uniref:Uncharacterized protein n=1 Tax=Russula ochroleuca TaxID=152965 RepID=A0A9P5N524_9AGAM|nr:hypothetical protein DFH94DRAFT_711071 [Russula ochroleuca]